MRPLKLPSPVERLFPQATHPDEINVSRCQDTPARSLPMKAKGVLRNLLAASLLCGLVGLGASTNTQIQSTEVQGVPCQGPVELRSDGRIKSCTLARDHTIAGYLLPAGTSVHFDEAGKVTSCVLGKRATLDGFDLPPGSNVKFLKNRADTYKLVEAAVIRGVELPAGATVFFWTPKGWESEVPGCWFCWLPKPVRIQGILCQSLNDGCGHIFYPSGRIRAVKLEGDQDIDGVPCTSSSNPFRMGMRSIFYGLDTNAWFHENGHLAQGWVARDCTIKGRNFKKGNIVRLTPDGSLDPAATTLGAQSRNAEKRTPPDSYIPGR